MPVTTTTQDSAEQKPCQFYSIRPESRTVLLNCYYSINMC